MVAVMAVVCGACCVWCWRMHLSQAHTNIRPPHATPSRIPAYLPAHPSAPHQFLHHEHSYNSYLVWKDNKDPLGQLVPGT